MRDRIRSDASLGPPEAGARIPSVILLRARVAAIKCREQLALNRETAAILELSVLHDALHEIEDDELGEAGVVEREKLILEARALARVVAAREREGN